MATSAAQTTTKYGIATPFGQISGPLGFPLQQNRPGSYLEIALNDELYGKIRTLETVQAFNAFLVGSGALALKKASGKVDAMEEATLGAALIRTAIPMVAIASTELQGIRDNVHSACEAALRANSLPPLSHYATGTWLSLSMEHDFAPETEAHIAENISAGNWIPTPNNPKTGDWK